MDGCSPTRSAAQAAHSTAAPVDRQNCPTPSPKNLVVTITSSAIIRSHPCHGHNAFSTSQTPHCLPRKRNPVCTLSSGTQFNSLVHQWHQHWAFFPRAAQVQAPLPLQRVAVPPPVLLSAVRCAVTTSPALHMHPTLSSRSTRASW